MMGHCLCCKTDVLCVLNTRPIVVGRIFQTAKQLENGSFCFKMKLKLNHRQKEITQSVFSVGPLYRSLYSEMFRKLLQGFPSAQSEDVSAKSKGDDLWLGYKIMNK